MSVSGDGSAAAAPPGSARRPSETPPRPRRWGRRALWSAVLVLSVGVGAFWYVARPAHLRTLLEHGLRNADLELVGLGDIAFSPWNGIEFTDLEVRIAGERAPDGARAARPHSRLHFGYARIDCDNWALLWGDFRPRAAQIRELTCFVLRDPAGPDWEWPEPAPDDHTNYPPLVDFLPRIDVQSADVQLSILDGDRPRLVRRWQFAAHGDRNYDAAGGRVFTLALRPTGGVTSAASTSTSDAPSLLEMRIFRDRIEGAVDWIEGDALIPMLPGRTAALLREVNFRGAAKLERAVIRDERVEEMTLRLSHVSGSAPFEENLPPTARFLQLTGGAATARLTRDEHRAPHLALDLTAQLNGAPARMTVRTTPVSGEALEPAEGAARPTVVKRMLDAVLGDSVRYDIDFSVDHIRAPTPEENPALFASSRLHPEARDFFVNFRPRGVGDIAVAFTGVAHHVGGRVEFDPPQRLEATCTPIDARIRYYRFPYDITDVRGRFRTGLDGIFLEGLTGRHGDARIQCDGFVENWYEWSPFTLLFHGTDVPLNRELYDALPEKDQRRWDEQWPLGVCDIDVVVDRVTGNPGGPPVMPTVSVDARLLTGSLLTPDGRRLEQAEGALSIREGAMRIVDLHAFLDGAPVRLRGEMLTSAEGAVATEMQLEAAGVPIDRSHEFRIGDAQRAVRFSGVADVWGRLCGPLPGQDPRDHFTLRLRNGALFDSAQGSPWMQAGGAVVLHDNVLRLSDFAAQRDAAQFSAAAVLPQSADSGEQMELDIGIRAPALERVVDALAPQEWSGAVHNLKLAGEGRVAVRVRPEVAGHNSDSGTSTPRPAGGGSGHDALQLSLEASSARPQWLPLPLRNLRAVAQVSESGFDLQSTHADLQDGGRLAVHGVGRWRGAQRGVELNLRADDVKLTPELIAAMPPRLAAFLTRIAPSGVVSLLLDRLDWSEAPAGDTWRIEGRIGLQNAAMRLGLGLTECTGEIVGGATLRPSGDLEPGASFTIERGKLAGRSLENWDGQITRSADGRWLKFVDLRGRLCRGTAVASVQVDLDSSEYELNLVMRDVDLDAFMQRTPTENEPVRAGSLDGHVFLRGVAGTDSSRRGQGEMTIANASFLKLPVLNSVAQASRQSDPTIGDTVTELKLRYNWEGTVLRFDRVSVESADLRLVGAGAWDTLSDRIELTLVGANPRDWPRVAVISTILEKAGQTLVRYRVEGRTDAPKVTIEPLGELTEPIRALLRE